MSPESKQRIVGIIVLVAFIALLIPFLFTNGVKKRTQVNGDEVPINSLQVNPSSTIEKLQLSGKEQRLAVVASKAQSESIVDPVLPNELQQQAMPAVAVGGVAGKTNPIGGDSRALSAESNSTQDESLPQPEVTYSPSLLGDVGTNSQVNQPTVSTPAANAAAHVVAAEENIVSIEPTKSKVITTTKKSAIKSKSAVTNKTRAVQRGSQTVWSVQVGCFSDQARMQTFVKNLQAKGFRVYLQKITTSHGLMVRVLVGREATKEKAIKLADHLRTSYKIDGRVIGSNK